MPEKTVIEGSSLAPKTPAAPPAGDPAPASGDQPGDQPSAAPKSEASAELVAKYEELRKQAEAKDQALQQMKTQIDKINEERRQQELSKMTEIDRYKAITEDMQKKLNDTIVENQRQQEQFKQQQWEMKRDQLVRASGLDPRFHSMIYGSNEQEVQSAITDLKGKLDAVKTEALKGVPPQMVKSEVGNPGVTNFQNEGTQPAAGQPQPQNPNAGYNQKKVDHARKNVKNVKDLFGYLQDPESVAILNNGRR